MVESRSVYKCDTQIHPFSGWTHPFFPSEILEREMVLRWSTRQKLRRWGVPLLCHVPSWLHGRFGRWPRLQILGSQAPTGGIAWMGNSFPPFTLYTYTTPVLWSQSYMVSSCFILHPPWFILEMFTGWTRDEISFFNFLGTPKSDKQEGAADHIWYVGHFGYKVLNRKGGPWHPLLK